MASKDRFATVVTKDDIMAKCKQFKAEYKTLQTTKWAYGIWNSWCKTRNISDELTQMTASRMDDVSQFTRRQDSEVYPPKTLFQIIASLQCHLRENGKPEIAIMINHI